MIAVVIGEVIEVVWVVTITKDIKTTEVNLSMTMEMVITMVAARETSAVKAATTGTIVSTITTAIGTIVDTEVGTTEMEMEMAEEVITEALSTRDNSTEAITIIKTTATNRTMEAVTTMATRRTIRALDQARHMSQAKIPPTRSPLREPTPPSVKSVTIRKLQTMVSSKVAMAIAETTFRTTMEAAVAEATPTRKAITPSSRTTPSSLTRCRTMLAEMVTTS